MKMSQTKRLERLIERRGNGSLDRRTFLGLSAAAAASLGLSARWIGPALAQVTEVRFDGWGGVVQEAIAKYAFEPYAAKTGRKIVQGSFDDENVARSLIKRIKDPAPPIRALKPDLPINDEAERLLLTMVEKDPDKRPDSAIGIVAAMDKALGFARKY